MTMIDHTAPIPPQSENVFRHVGIDISDAQWQPLDGYKSDAEALDTVRGFIDRMGGKVIERERDDDWPVGIGALMSVIVTDDNTLAPFVLLRDDLSADLAADILSFCHASAACNADIAAATPDGYLAIGTHRQMVTGPGVGLLATLMARRVGRNTGSAAFLTYTPPMLFPDQYDD